MLIGYNLLSQDSFSAEIERTKILAVQELVQVGCDKIYIDFLPAKRRQLYQALSLIKTGDTLIVPRIDVFGESQSSFLQRLDLLKNQGAILQTLEENYLLLPNSSLIECLNLVKKLFPDEKNYSPSIPLTRNYDRTGRPSLSVEQKELIRLLQLVRINQKKISVSKICRLAKVCRQSYYNFFPLEQKSA